MLANLLVANPKPTGGTEKQTTYVNGLLFFRWQDKCADLDSENTYSEVMGGAGKSVLANCLEVVMLVLVGPGV